MINAPLRPADGFIQPKESSRIKLLAALCGVAVTVVLLTGYTYMRNRHAQQVLASAIPPIVADAGPKGPALAHILIDDPLLSKSETIIGGTVKNISQQELSGLAISLELKRRKDGGNEQVLVPVKPDQLQPQQEGVYMLKLPIQRYGSIRFIGLKAGPQATLIAYTSAQGKKRPPERLEPRTVVVRPSRSGEFLNTPDNPTRVP
jgi:hypothetical protein